MSRAELSPCQPSCTSKPRDARGGRRRSPCGTFGATSLVASLPEDAPRVPEALWPSRSNGGDAPSQAQTLRLIPEKQTQIPPAQWEPKGSGISKDAFLSPGFGWLKKGLRCAVGRRGHCRPEEIGVVAMDASRKHR